MIAEKHRQRKESTLSCSGRDRTDQRAQVRARRYIQMTLFGRVQTVSVIGLSRIVVRVSGLRRVVPALRGEVG